MSNDDPLNEILKKIELGELSADEGLALINQLDGGAAAAASDVETVSSDDESGVYTSEQADADEDQPGGQELEAEIDRWWIIPFGIGIFITLMGAGFIYWGLVAAGFSWGFWLSWIPFLLGQAIMALSWYSQKAPWLHVRIRQRPGDKPGLIAFSFPLPLKLAASFFRYFGRYIPQLEGKQLDLILESLHTSLSKDSPLYVHVNEDGEDVQVYMG